MAKIIGHRGAAGLALENSRASLRAALRYEVDAIELDVRLTADGEAVLCHDDHTGRVAEKKLTLRRTTLAELKKIKLNNGERILTLDEALKTLGTAKPIWIEIKDRGMADEVMRVVRRHPHAKVSFLSFQHSELRRTRKILPQASIYVSEHLDPLEVVHQARKMHATGIVLNKWLANPVTYHLAKRYGLQVCMYTVNSRLWYHRFFRPLYPEAAIFTNHPERFAPLRKK